MQLGMVGLGKMGGNMVKRLLRGGHTLVVTARTAESVAKLVKEGAIGAKDVSELVGQLQPPRIVWVMVPAGEITEQTIMRLTEQLSPGDIIIDGGNSYYKDTQRRAQLVKAKGLQFVDVGTSGGIWGLTEGYGLMIGGDADAVTKIRPILATLAPAPERGWGRVGPSGAGHFVKMVHNGIEYGLMQAYAEGFDILRAKTEFNLDLAQIAEQWRYGTVIRSWLLDLTARALAENPQMDGLAPYVTDSGEGRWTVKEAIDLDVPAPVITLSLQNRFASRVENSFAARLLAAMRQQFGGHAVKKA